MQRVSSLGTLAVAGFLSFLLCSEARAENETPDHLEGTKIPHKEGENDYATKGLWELGGGIDFSWTQEQWDVGLNPQVGYFIKDCVELSLLTGVMYEKLEVPGEGSVDTWTVEILVEPSYHHPLTDSFFVFGGLGVGLAYNFEHPQFDLHPRAGFNIEVGRSGILTPAVKVPIYMGKNSGSADDDFGVDVGVDVGAAYTTTF